MMRQDVPPIPPRFLIVWAREQLLSVIDAHLAEGDFDWDADDERALQKERDRIAKFLGLLR